MRAVVWFGMFIGLFIGSTAQANDFEWTVASKEWSRSDEQKFSTFVVSIGNAVEKRSCGSVNQCMRSSANPYRGTDPARLYFKADCADFPYFLRAYFAWKQKLPFGMVKHIRPNAGEANEGRDIRYTPLGNRPSERISFVPSSSGLFLITSVLNTYIPNFISTATFRSGYQDGTGRNRELFSDMYPVKIERGALVPGTNLYDANGHAGVIYKVTDDGQVWYVDAHPDNSLTVGRFGSKFSRSSPDVGAGFKKWRPLVLENAEQTWEGTYEDGNLVGVPNSRIKDFSTEQFFGNVPNREGNWRKAQFAIEGKSVTFAEFVRLKMAKGRLKQNPVNEFGSSLKEICMFLQDRVASVQAAVTNGITSKPYPERLPINIYGSAGEWEDFSTPGRDVTLKMLFLQLKAQSTDLIKRAKAGDPDLEYTGSNLPADLLKLYDQESPRCQFSYQNSNGQAVPLNLAIAQNRLFQFSFSPYDCVERRWGAAGGELSTCQDDSEKTEWYKNLQQLRNHTERNVDAKMDFTRGEFGRLIPGVGIQSPEDLDIRRHLKSLQ
jgi:hypothetical protein